MVVHSPLNNDKALEMLQKADPHGWQAAVRRAHLEIKQQRKTHCLQDDKEGNALAVKHVLTAGSCAGYYALKVATGLLDYKKQIEGYHTAAELKAFRLQQAYDALDKQDWHQDEKDGLRIYYSQELDVQQDRVEMALHEVINVAKLLGTHNTVPEALTPHRPGHGRDRGNTLHA